MLAAKQILEEVGWCRVQARALVGRVLGCPRHRGTDNLKKLFGRVSGDAYN